MTDPRDHDGDLADHDADLGDHDPPIRLIMMRRSWRSRWAETRSQQRGRRPAPGGGLGRRVMRIVGITVPPTRVRLPLPGQGTGEELRERTLHGQRVAPGVRVWPFDD